MAAKIKRSVPKRRNPVAKVAGKFNRAARHADRKQSFKRGALKHRKRLERDAD